MLFIKKLILISALGGGITIPTVKSITYSEPDEKLLEYDAITKKWERLLKKIPQSELSKKLSSLFSANLTTFAKTAMENTAKQLLVNWIIEIWENPDYYFPISYRLNKFFSDYQLSHWKIKNDVDELSWELIKTFFIDFFFKEKGWLLLSQYGDFRTFVLNDWIDQEKPMMIYEWNIDYAPSSSSKIYTEEIIKTRTSNDSYLWPEFAYNEQYSTFISRFKNSNKVDLNSFSKKIYTISELKTIEDGYKLGTLLHLLTYVGSNWSTISPDSISELKLQKSTEEEENKKDSYLENPLYLFLERKEQTEETNEDISMLARPSDCFLIKNSIFNTEFSKRISNYDWKKPDYHYFSSNTHSCLYGLREIKNNLRTNEKLFASRESKGISLYYLPHYKVEYSIDELSNDVSQKLETYLKNNFEMIFFKYLNSKVSTQQGQQVASQGSFNLTLLKETPEASNIGKWDFATHYQKYKDLLNASLEYRETLYWMNNIYELQKILTKVYNNLPPKILLKELKNGTNGQSQSNPTWKIQLPSTEGLFNPLPFKRSSDENSEEEEEIKFSELRSDAAATRKRRSADQKERKNDGFFSHLFNSLNTKKNFYSLEEKAHKLKQTLSEKITTTDIKNLFLNDLFLRSQFERIAEEKEKSEFSLFKLWAEKTLFNEAGNGAKNDESDFSQMISNYTSSVLKSNEQTESESAETTTNNGWNDLIEKTIFLEKYLNLPIEERAIFGNYKHNFKNETESDEKKVTIEDDKDNKKISLKAKNSWILKNYYLSDSAYESTSEEYRNFLSYLYSVYWMTKNNYENLPNLISHIFKKDANKNAYLIWFKEIKEKELDSLKNTNEEAKNGKNGNDNLSKLFETQISNDILNPLLMGKTTIEIPSSTQNNGSQSSANSSIQDLQFNSENYLFKTHSYTKKSPESENNNSSNNVDLAGFAGLFTSNFSTREIPKTIKDTIFDSFWLKNSPSNTNYSDSAANSTSQNDSIGGIYFEDNHEKEFKNNDDLKKFLLNFKYKWKIQKYLDLEDEKRPHPKLLTALVSPQKAQEEKKDIEELTIQELKEKIENTLGNNIKQVDSSPEGASSEFTSLYKAWNRFSGYLYNGKEQQYPYVLTVQEGGKNKYYLAFLYQVNRFDFEKDKISDLKTKISENTFKTMISLLASNKEVSDWIYRFDLANKLSLF